MAPAANQTAGSDWKSVGLRWIEWLATGVGSNVVAGVLTLNLLAVLFVGKLSVSILGLSLSTPSRFVSLLLWLGFSALRFAHQRWQPGTSQKMRRWCWTRRFELAVWGLAVLGLALRLWGIQTGLPALVDPDEPTVVSTTVKMLKTGSCDPGIHYVTFFMYLMLPSFAVYYAFFQSTWPSLAELPLRAPDFFALARVHSALLGTLTILLTFYLAKRLWPGERGKQAGLIGAAFVTFAFNHVRQSHFAVTDVPMTAMVMLALFAIVGVLQRGSHKDYALAGFLCGLACATKPTALPIVYSLIAAHLFGRPLSQWLSRSLALGLASVPIGFVVGAPYALLDWPTFLEGMKWVDRFVGSASVEQSQQSLAWVLGYARESGLGWPFTLAAIAALAVALYRRSASEWVLWVFVLGSIQAAVASSHQFYPRYFATLIPPLAMLVGYLLATGFDVLRTRQWLTARSGAVALAALTGVMIFPQARETIAWDRFRARDDSRTAAYKWIASEFEPGTVVASEVDRLSIIPGYKLVEWSPLESRTLRRFLREGVELALFEETESSARRRRRMQNLFEPLMVFPGRSGGNPGPTIHAYRVVPDDLEAIIGARAERNR